MVDLAALANESVWMEKYRYEDAERAFYESLSTKGTSGSTSSSVADEIARAREHIKNSLATVDSVVGAVSSSPEVSSRLQQLESENTTLKKFVDDLRAQILSLDARVKTLEGQKGSAAPAAPAAKPTEEKKADEDDDDVDLFGSDDEEDTEAEKLKEERLAAYAAKKSKKPTLIAKSSVILDVKPWDDETDMAEMERRVREVTCDGLLWGASKLVPLAYGIKKLQINCVVEDEKVSIDWLTETIQENEDFVQSVDIAAFNKI